MNGENTVHQSVRITFCSSQDEAKSFILLLLEHDRLLVHHAVTVEKMPSRAAVSAAHHSQHGHGRPGRVEVHAGRRASPAGAGQPPPDPRPHPTPPAGSGYIITRYDGGPGSLATASPEKDTTPKMRWGGKKMGKKTADEDDVIPFVATAFFVFFLRRCSRRNLLRRRSGLDCRGYPRRRFLCRSSRQRRRSARSKGGDIGLGWAGLGGSASRPTRTRRRRSAKLNLIGLKTR